MNDEDHADDDSKEKVHETTKFIATATTDFVDAADAAENQSKIFKWRGLTARVINITAISIMCIPYLIDIDLLFSDTFTISYIFFCLNILCIMNVSFYYHVEDIVKTNKKIGFIKIASLLYKKVKIFRAAISHFGDTATDISVLIEFYHKKNNTDSTNINYNQLFTVTLIVLIFYRIVSSIKIYFFSRKIFNALLQLCDLYIIKIIGISIKIGKSEPSIVQKHLQFTEALFESSPQALITLFVMFDTIAHNGISSISIPVMMSFLFSVSSIINRAVAQDAVIFTAWYVITVQFIVLNLYKRSKTMFFFHIFTYQEILQLSALQYGIFVSGIRGTLILLEIFLFIV